MGKAVIGFKDLDPDLHGMMANFIQSDYPGRRLLGLAPRDHLKTSVWTIADTVRRFTADPNIRILIVNETAGNARNFLSKIKSVVERGEIYRWLFPDVVPDFNKVRWTQDQIEVNRTKDFPEATVEVIGVGGASTSRHYNLIKEDDLVGKEASESPIVMEKAIDQHKLAESLLNSPDDLIQTVGTRWAPYDLVEWMYKNEPNIDHLRLEILRPDGSPLWPTRFRAHQIEALRVKYGPAMFALQYENRCIGTGVTDLDEAWLRYYVEEHLADGDVVYHCARPPGEGGPFSVRLSELETCTVCDPCLSPDSGDARTAVVSMGVTHHEPFNVLILGATAKKVDPKVTIDIAAEEAQKFNSMQVGIECIAGQVAFFYWACERHPKIPWRKLKTEKGPTKFGRIRSAGTFFSQGRVYVNRRHVDFLEEYIAFPNGKTVDLLDAYAYGPQMWCPPTMRLSEEEELEVELQTRAKVYQRMQGRSPVTGY